MTTKKGKKIEEMKDYALSERIAELEKAIRELKKTVVESQRCSPAIIDKDAIAQSKLDRDKFIKSFTGDNWLFKTTKKD